MHTHTPLTGKAQPWGVRVGVPTALDQMHTQPPRQPSLIPSGFSLQRRSLGVGVGVHQERLSQGRPPHGVRESPVELLEDCEPPGDTLEMLFQQLPGHTLAQPG